MFRRLVIQSGKFAVQVLETWDSCPGLGDQVRLKCRRLAARVQETCEEFGIFHLYFSNPGKLRLMSGRLAA